MKLPILSVKRRTVKKGAFRKLFANVARKKHRAATAAAPMAQAEGDVPNLGIARALVVILVIHIVAIAGIFAHSHFFEGAGQKAAAAEAASKQELLQPVKPLRDAGETLSKIAENDPFEVLVAGDTYLKVAEAHGVTEQELRDANGNMELRAGRSLRIPARTIVAKEPDELVRLREGSVVLEAPVDEIRSAPMVETEAAGAPVLVRPGINRDSRTVGKSAPPKATPVDAVPAATKKYTVKSGDTFWKIAKANGTTPDVVMNINRITDPRKLKAGMQLLVP